MSKKKTTKKTQQHHSPPTNPDSKPSTRKGKPNVARPVTVCELARCPHCDTTDGPRSQGNKDEKQIDGQRPDGKLYNWVVWRRCKCLNCGGYFMSITYEHRANGTPS